MNFQTRALSRPDTYLNLQRRKAVDALTKRATISALSAAHKRHEKEIVAQFYGNDRSLLVTRPGLLVTRASQTPSSMTGEGASLVSMGLVTGLASLGPATAGAALLETGMQFQFGTGGVIQVPAIVNDATKASFVGEGQPIPVRQLLLTGGVTLNPRKFAAICVFTRETFEHTTPAIELIVRQVLAESTGLAFDTALFDASAGDSTRPAGLRNSIAALGTESANADLVAAMRDDVATLIEAVGPVAGNNPVVLVCNPKQAARLRAWMWPNFSVTVLSSSGVAAGDVLAIASNALASAVDPAPRFESSIVAVVHMSDTPDEIGTTGTLAGAGNGGVKSMFQTGTVATKMLFSVSWGLRNAGGLAWFDAVTW